MDFDDVLSLTSTVNQHERSLTDVETSLQQLRWDLDSLGGKQDQFEQRINTLEIDAIEGLNTTVAGMKRQADALDDRLDQTRRALKHLTGQVQWLEHQVRADQEEVQTAVLDDAGDSDLRWLAAQALEGRTARAKLCSTRERDHWQWLIRHHDKLHEQHHDLLEQAAKDSKPLADAPTNNAEHTTATERFTQSLAAANALADQLNDIKPAYIDAKTRLEADDTYRRTHGPIIIAGEEHDTALRRRLRDLITQAISSRALLPIWFTTVMGYSPPAEHTGNWLSVAVDLLAYRITYQVDDQLVALGPEPPTKLTPRRAWYTDLATALRDLHK